MLWVYHLFNVLVLQLLKTSSKQDSTSCTPLVGPRTRRRTRCGHQDLALQAGPIAWCWLHFLLSTCLYMFVFNCTRSWAHQHWWSCQNYQEAKAKALWETSSSHGMHGYRRVLVCSASSTVPYFFFYCVLLHLPHSLAGSVSTVDRSPSPQWDHVQHQHIPRQLRAADIPHLDQGKQTAGAKYMGVWLEFGNDGGI